MVTRGRLVALLGLGLASLAACVGDDPSPSPAAPSSKDDAGADASDAAAPTSRDDAGADASDAATPACDEGLPWGPAKPVLGLNAAGANHSGPTLSADERTAYFTSTRDAADAGPGRGKSDLFVAKRATRADPFGAPSAVLEVSSIEEEYSPTLSDDGLSLLFHSNRGGASNAVYLARRGTPTADFGVPAALAGVPLGAVTPFLRADGKELFYSLGGKIHHASGSVATGFAGGTRAAELDGSGLDNSPVLSRDGRTLYFASNRTEGGSVGDTDIWVATRATEGDPFGGLRNVTELNTGLGELPAWLSPDGCRLYLARANAGGTYELHVAERAP